jgi:hypothetical protein
MSHLKLESKLIHLLHFQSYTYDEMFLQMKYKNNNGETDNGAEVNGQW